MSSDPQPAVTQVVVHEEDVALLEGDLVRVRHLRVRQDGHHPLLVVHRLCNDGGDYRSRRSKRGEQQEQE